MAAKSQSPKPKCKLQHTRHVKKKILANSHINAQCFTSITQLPSIKLGTVTVPMFLTSLIKIKINLVITEEGNKQADT